MWWMELRKKKGKRFLLLKETSIEHGLKENRAEVFLSISERSAGLRNVKNLLCPLDYHYRHSDIKGKAEFLLKVAFTNNTHAMLLNAESTCEASGT